MHFKNIFANAQFGFYQKRLLFILFYFSTTNPFVAFLPLITQYTPPHHCNVRHIAQQATNQATEIGLTAKDLESLVLNYTIPWITDEFGKLHRSSCEQYNVSMISLQEHTNFTNWPQNESATTPCTSIYYDSDVTSLVTEFDLVCENSQQRPLYVSVMMVGNTVGGLVSGIISDRFGRKYTFLAILFLQVASTLLMSFTQSVEFYAVTIFATGYCNSSGFALAVLIGSEMVSTGLRGFSYFILAFGFSVGYMLFAAVMYIFQDWRWSLRLYAIMGIPLVSCIWLIDETPYWLYATGKSKKAEAVLSKIAKLNKQPGTQIEEIERSLETKSNSDITFCNTCKSVVCNFTLLSRVCIVTLAWCIVTLTYFAIALNTNNLSGDRIMNAFYAGLVELLSTLLFYLVVESRGRKNTYIGCMAVSSVFVAATPFLTFWNDGVVVASTMVSKLLVSIAYNLLYVYTGELFPTMIRQMALGICIAASKLGSLFAPIIIYAGEQGNTIVPSVVMAATMILSVITFVVLPETSKQLLPQTIDDAVMLKGGLKVRCCTGRRVSEEDIIEL